MEKEDGDVECGFGDEVLHRSGSQCSAASDFEPQNDAPSALSNRTRGNRIKRSRNTGTAPRLNQDVRVLRKAGSFPFWGNFQKIHSGLKDVFSSNKQRTPGQEAVFLRRNSIPGAFGQAKRRSTVGQFMSSMLPVGLTTEDPDEDLWFTSLDDFQKPTIVMEKTHMSTCYFIKASICKRNFVMREYIKENLTEKEEKYVSRYIDLMQWIRHPNITKCLGAWETQDAYYTVEEYCHRANLLCQSITNRRSFTEEHVVNKLLKPLLDALIYLHSMQIVHRKVIPENVQFGKGNVLRLSGLLHAIDFTRSRPCSRLGPLDYTPPEVLEITDQSLNGDADASDDHRLSDYNEKIDVWQVGVMVYELLSGICPFEVQDQLLCAHYISLTEVQNFPPGLSSEATDFIRKALTKEPHKRPTAEELAQHPWMTLFERRKSKGDEKKKMQSIWRCLKDCSAIVTILKQSLQKKVVPHRSAEEEGGQDPEHFTDNKRSLSEASVAIAAKQDEADLPVLDRPPSEVQVPSILNIDFDVPDVLNLEQRLW